MDEEIDLRDDGPREIDLSDRLRFAAVSLAADYRDHVTADHAEALVFSSAEGLLATASVTDFVPILAERRARHAVRSGAATAAAPPAPTPASRPAGPAPSPIGEPPADGSAPEPLFAVPDEALTRLRDRVDRVRVRVSDWRATQDGR